MALPILDYQQTLARLPLPVANTNLAQSISHQLQLQSLPILVVLDDDPTGTQTCHGINVLTVWDLDVLVEEFQACTSGFFILTNTRAVPSNEAYSLVRSVCEAVQRAASIVQKDFEIVLRGDSTLRGHFPGELHAAEEVIGKADLWVLAPFFAQGHRVTINDIHYIAESEKLVPVAQTPFAKDATFGFKSSNLADYVVEKSRGEIRKKGIFSISLQDLRVSGATEVLKKLLAMPSDSVVIVNAVAVTDLEVFVQAVLESRAYGKKYIYRTAASFVSTRLGIHQISPFTIHSLHKDLSSGQPGGLIIAGSYVPNTTRQLEKLLEGRGPKLAVIVLDVESLLASPDTSQQSILDAVKSVDEHISSGKDTLVMTSRKLIVGDGGTSSLSIGGVIAHALVGVLSALGIRPRYIIAKGGITSSDAATKGLQMRRARILGQAASGIPLWQCNEPTSKFPGVPFIVFPGNVGSDIALRDLVASWAWPE